jgi:aerobic carbon-monoxide dehydrogenase small subunit
MGKRVDISVVVNGHRYERAVEPRLHLADFLRRELGLTGTHIGCEQGVCGNCTVLLGDEAVKSCLLFAVQVDGLELTTVEGLAPADGLSALQQAFKDEHALQCGFCTPGFLMTAAALARQGAQPTLDELRGELAGVLCRCTGYEPIVSAVHRYLSANGTAPHE